MRYIFLFFVLIFIIILALPVRADEPAIGQPAPALVARELNGTPFDLSTKHGKIVIIHFWSTWCPSCHEEMAVLEKFNTEHKDHGVEIIALSLDKPRKRDEVKTFMKPFSFPAAILDSDISANGFGSPGSIPVTYIVDGKGIVRAMLTPEDQALTVKELEDVVNPLLQNNLVK